METSITVFENRLLKQTIETLVPFSTEPGNDVCLIVTNHHKRGEHKKARRVIIRQFLSKDDAKKLGESLIEFSK